MAGQAGATSRGAQRRSAECSWNGIDKGCRQSAGEGLAPTPHPLSNPSHRPKARKHWVFCTSKRPKCRPKPYQNTRSRPSGRLGNNVLPPPGPRAHFYGYTVTTLCTLGFLVFLRLHTKVTYGYGYILMVDGG